MGNNKSNKTEMQPKNKSMLKQTLSQVTSGTKTKDSAGEIAKVYSMNERINELSSLMRKNTEHIKNQKKQAAAQLHDGMSKNLSCKFHSTALRILQNTQ